MQPRAVPSTDTTAGDDSAPTSTRATELHPADPEAPAVASRAGRHLIASLFACSRFSQTGWALRLGGWPRADIAAWARRISATAFVGHGRCICITSRTATTISTSAAYGVAHEQSPEQSTAGPGDTAAFTKHQLLRRRSTTDRDFCSGVVGKQSSSREHTLGPATKRHSRPGCESLPSFPKQNLAKAHDRRALFPRLADCSGRDVRRLTRLPGARSRGGCRFRLS